MARRKRTPPDISVEDIWADIQELSQVDFDYLCDLIEDEPNSVLRRRRDSARRFWTGVENDKNERIGALHKKLSRRQPEHTEEERLLRELESQGLTDSEIARQMNSSVDAIRKRRARAGRKKPRPGK